MTDTAGAHSYAYDRIYQLIQATHPAIPTEQFSYDPVGNRLNTVDAGNRLLEDSTFTYAYDNNGNLITKTKKATGEITRYYWDSENRLIRVEGAGLITQYRYDSFGRRIEKDVNGIKTRYVYDGNNIVFEYDGSNLLMARYTHNLTIDDPLTMEKGGQTYYYYKDALGSITALTDGAGTVAQTYTYDSFGNIVSQTGSISQPFTYTAREYDSETGLYYYRARYYDAKAGRFISADPLNLVKILMLKQSSSKKIRNVANRIYKLILRNPLLLMSNEYNYVKNNPVRFTDPSGKFSWPHLIFELLVEGYEIGSPHELNREEDKDYEKYLKDQEELRNWNEKIDRLIEDTRRLTKETEDLIEDFKRRKKWEEENLKEKERCL